MLVLDHDGTHLGAALAPIVPLAADPSLGAETAYKRSGRDDLYLVPLGEALERAHAAGRARDPLRVVADEATPYRVLLEALYTAAQCGIRSYEICENSCEQRMLRTVAPTAGLASAAEPRPSGLRLAAWIVDEGVVLKTAGGNMAPGCESVGAGVTIPRSGTALDLAALASCIVRLKGAAPEYAEEDTALVAASPHTVLRDVMDAALALQSAFPRILLGIVR